MSFTDVISRVSQIQTELASVRTAFVPQTARSSSSSSTSGGAAVSGATGATSFATQLAAAQGTSPTSGTTGAAGVLGTTATTGSGSATLPAGASRLLTSGQQAFAARVASDTGLDPSVVSAWVLAEESGSAAVSRAAQGNNDWLNIGYTDSGTYGSADGIWANPVSAADATAGWLKGQDTIPGYGTASSGIRSILSTAGQSPGAQISAIQSSGWASSGYPSLPSLLSQVSG